MESRRPGVSASLRRALLAGTGAGAGSGSGRGGDQLEGQRRGPRRGVLLLHFRVPRAAADRLQAAPQQGIWVACALVGPMYIPIN